MKRRFVLPLSVAMFVVLTFAGAVQGTPQALPLESGLGPSLPNDPVAPPSLDGSEVLNGFLYPVKESSQVVAWQPKVEDMTGLDRTAQPCRSSGPCQASEAGVSQLETSLDYQATRPSRPESLADQATGGPDEFGYRWDDSIAMAWIDASGGTDTGISNSVASSGAIEIGFPFKFYEYIYTRIFVSRSGFLTFDSRDLQNEQSRIPSDFSFR